MAWNIGAVFQEAGNVDFSGCDVMLLFGRVYEDSHDLKWEQLKPLSMTLYTPQAFIFIKQV